MSPRSPRRPGPPSSSRFGERPARCRQAHQLSGRPRGGESHAVRAPAFRAPAPRPGERARAPWPRPARRGEGPRLSALRGPGPPSNGFSRWKLPRKWRAWPRPTGTGRRPGDSSSRSRGQPLPERAPWFRGAARPQRGRGHGQAAGGSRARRNAAHARPGSAIGAGTAISFAQRRGPRSSKWRSAVRRAAGRGRAHATQRAQRRVAAQDRAVPAGPATPRALQAELAGRTRRAAARGRPASAHGPAARRCRRGRARAPGRAAPASRAAA